MKILAVITGMQNGGAERVMATLCNEFSKNNEVRLAIMKSSKSDYEIIPQVTVVAGNVKHNSFFPSIKFIKKEIENWKPDIILSFMTKSNIVTIIANKLAKKRVPLVISERANPYNAKLFLRILRKYLYKSVDGCVFQTYMAQEYYNGLIKESKVIYNPLSSTFKVIEYNGARKNKIVCTARLSPEKNQKLLIDAFAIVHEKFPEYTLEIYGKGPEYQNLQKQIDRLNINESITLMGRVDNIQEYIKDAKVFVLPSNSEGMPNSLLEALAMGIPCIATDSPIGGSAILIKNDINGFLIPMNNKEIMAEKIEELITNTEKANRFSENAKKVLEDFETQRVCREWEEYLKRIRKGV